MRRLCGVVHIHTRVHAHTSGTSEEARCAALVERFNEARAMRRAMLILEDVDILLAAPGADETDAAPGEGAIS